jgi:hypothetical protein
MENSGIRDKPIGSAAPIKMQLTDPDGDREKITKRCRLSLLTNSSLIWVPMRGEEGGCRVSANEGTAAQIT